MTARENMNKTIAFGVAGIALAAAMLAVGFAAGRSPAAAPAAPEVVQAPDSAELARADVETIIREYLVANPEIVAEAQEALEAKQREEQRIAQEKVIKDARGEIFNAAYDGVIGNPAGKRTIVEFFDYNCGYCKRALTDMQELVKVDPELRFVLKEFPILGPDSQKAHVVSMAFRTLMPQKYTEFHQHLLGDPGKSGEAKAIKVALSLGADEAKLREEMKNQAINEAFSKTYDLANRLNITGTPSYVIGNEVVFGAMGREVLEEKLASAPVCETANC
jgi:protein-disulfide isomerase